MKTVSDIEAYLAKGVSEITLGAVLPDEVTSDLGLISDLGLDSLDYASLMLMAESWVGVNVAEESVNWREVRSVRQLALLLHGLQDADPS